MYELTRIWNVEELPEEWKISVLCPIYKKGDKLECGNFRGIALLNTPYQRLLSYMESTAGGFREGRSTADQVFSIGEVQGGQHRNTPIIR